MANYARVLGQSVNKARKDPMRRSFLVYRNDTDYEKVITIIDGNPAPEGYHRMCTCSPADNGGVLVRFND